MNGAQPAGNNQSITANTASLAPTNGTQMLGSPASAAAASQNPGDFIRHVLSTNRAAQGATPDTHRAVNMQVSQDSNGNTWYRIAATTTYHMHNLKAESDEDALIDGGYSKWNLITF